MNSHAQLAIVYGIVAVAAIYAFWRFVPGLKKALAPKLATGLNRSGLISDEKATQLAATLSKSAGCGSCDSCGSCGPKDARAKPSSQS